MMTENERCTFQKLLDEFDYVNNLLEDKIRKRCAIHKYNETRLAAAERELKANDLMYCTMCSDIQSIRGSRYLFIKEAIALQWGALTREFSIVESEKLYHCCEQCTTRSIRKNGQTGKYDHRTGKQESFHVTLVERNSSGFYLLEGILILLSPEKVQTLDAIPPKVVDTICREYKLPPKLEFDAFDRVIVPVRSETFSATAGA